jgi:hypothetical protein
MIKLGLNKDEDCEDWRKVDNEKLHNFQPPNIIVLGSSI